MLPKGKDVQVNFEWFPNAGMKDGGFYLHIIGTVQEETAEIFSLLDKETKKLLVVPFTSVKFIQLYES
jgi:hypothetical protein